MHIEYYSGVLVQRNLLSPVLTFTLCTIPFPIKPNLVLNYRDTGLKQP